MLHWCLRCGVLFGNYRRHMDEAHEGRSDCVANVSAEQAGRILDGESVYDVLCVRRVSA